MKIALKTLIMAGSLTAGLGLAPNAFAQTARTTDGAVATTPARPAGSATTTRRTTTEIVEPGMLEPGANSFTSGQVRRRLAAAGLTDLQGLRKNANGIWTARAKRGTETTDVAIDFHGHIAAGTGVAALATATARPASATTTATGARPDGTAGNPPSTMTGRAVDRAQGEAPRPDGTPSNPPGTAAGRAMDRTLGTNTTGANPAGSRPDGAPGNPPSTMTGRAADRAMGETPRPDGTPGNPAGTAAGRAMDRTLGTNTTGTNPAGTAR